MWWKGLFLFCIESKEKWQKTYPSLRRRAAQFASGARRSCFLGCCFPTSYRAVQTESEACVETSVGVQPSLTSTLKSGDVGVPPRWPVLLALRALASSGLFLLRSLTRENSCSLFRNFLFQLPDLFFPLSVRSASPC